MNKYKSYASSILLGSHLEDKITLRESDELLECAKVSSPAFRPERSSQISFSEKQIKFPKGEYLLSAEGKGKALHFFANHELLAIELFAWGMIRFDLSQDEIKKVLATIKDEQKHLSLYVQRLEQLGVELGDYPLNDFLWRVVSSSESKEQFFALIALTFEQANLDFMLYYMDLFKKQGDFETFNILNIVYKDEINHVKRGVDILNGHQISLWEKYNELLPEKVTPARAKGMLFDRIGRKKAGLDNKFIDSLENYFDQFNITHRSQWKKNDTSSI